jgi:hypothetical protein
VSTSSADSDAGKAAARPSLSVTQLLAAKGTRPIRSLEELAADTFESDEELEEFLAFTYAERPATWPDPPLWTRPSWTPMSPLYCTGARSPGRLLPA